MSTSREDRINELAAVLAPVQERWAELQKLHEERCAITHAFNHHTMLIAQNTEALYDMLTLAIIKVNTPESGK